MTKRTAKQPSKSSAKTVAQLTESMKAAAAFEPLLQALHDLSLTLGAKCHHCGERHDEHQTDSEKPKGEV